MTRGGVFDISPIVINTFIGFKSIITSASTSLFLALYLSVEEEGHKGRSTIIYIQTSQETIY